MANGSDKADQKSGLDVEGQDKVRIVIHVYIIPKYFLILINKMIQN